MITLGLDYAWYPEQRHQEMLAEAKRQHLVEEALKARGPRTHPISRFAAYLGKKLVALGTRLVERYDARPQPEINEDIAQYPMQLMINGRAR